jgi:hypothetical protein
MCGDKLENNTISSSSASLNSYTQTPPIVLDWKCTFNTPHHLRTESPSLCFDSGTGGSIKNCILAKTYQFGGVPLSYSEGIHYSDGNIVFKKIPLISYNVRVDAERFNCTNDTEDLTDDDLPSTLVIKAANNLPNCTSVGLSLWPYPYGEGVTNFEIGQMQIPKNGSNCKLFNFVPGINYEHLQFYVLVPTTVEKKTYTSIRSAEVSCQTSALTGFTATTGMPNNCGLTYNFVPILNHNGCEKDEKFSWIIKGINNDAPFSTSENATFTFPSTGRFEVCLRYTDCYGCCAEVCQKVEVTECSCQPKPGFTEVNATANGGVNISTFFGTTTTYSGVRWLVKGNLIINQNTTLDNSIIEFDVNARITVNPGVTFFIQNNSVLQAGCEQMWAGVFYSGSGRYRMWGSTLRDAENGLSVSGSAVVQLVGNTFERNFNCINVSRASKPFRGLSGNTFNGSQSLIVPRLGQQGNAGIVGNDTGELDIRATPHPSLPIQSGENTFSFLLFGVKLERYTKFTSISNFFQNMRTGGSTIDLLSQTSLGSTTLTSNNFNIGHRAINIARCDGIIDIKTNEFFNHILPSPALGRNIQVNNCANLILRITNSNVFNSTTLPVEIVNVRGGEVRVLNNTFNTSGQNLTINSVRPLCLISSNTFNSYLIYAISGFNMSNADIRSNTVNANNRNGIFCNSSPGAILFNNTVNNGSQFSFQISNSENFNAECNTLNTCNRGIDVTSAVIRGFLTTNFMNTITTQSLRMSNCAIGLQDKRGNRFTGLFSQGQLINSDPVFNIFQYVNTSLSGGQSWFPAQITGVPAGTQWFEQVMGGTNQLCGFQPQAASNATASQLVNAVNGTVLNNLYYEQNVWSSQWYVLHALTANPTLMNGNSTLTNFFNSPSVVKSYFDMNRNIDNLFDFTPSEASTLTTYGTQLNTKLAELDALQALVTDQNYTQYIAPIEAKHTEIMAFIDAISPIVNTATNRALTNALAYKSAVAALPEPKYFCDEYKLVYNARLDVVLYGETYVINHYASALSAQASKCHIDFGFAVHAAVDLCNRYGIVYSYSDCDVPQPRQGDISTAQENEVKMYPNPTSSRLLIESKLPIVNYSLVDVSGRSIKSDKIESTLSLDLDLSTIINGVYFMKVTDESGKTHIKKIFKL